MTMTAESSNPPKKRTPDSHDRIDEEEPKRSLKSAEFERMLRIRQAVATGEFEQTRLNGCLGADEEYSSDADAADETETAEQTDRPSKENDRQST